MANVGIVCEGSHDFLYLKPIIENVLISRGHVVGNIDALQPRVDATSRQLDGGGYQAVQQWLLANRGLGLQKFLGNGLFASSNNYDAIVVHLDGDVPDISAEYALSHHPKTFPTIVDRVNAVKAWIVSLSQPRPADLLNIIAAIPVLQTEAWVLAGLGSANAQLEQRNWKDVAKRVLAGRFQGKAVSQVTQAASAALARLGAMRTSVISFNEFVNDFHARF